MKKIFIKFIALFLVGVFSFMFAACNPASDTAWLNPTLSDPNEQVETEDEEIEDEEIEETLTEFITSEIYLEELTEAEQRISELLIGEDIINEVILCKTVYVPQDHIEDFSEHSQTQQIFGGGIDFRSLATKIAIGTGIIVTLVVLSKVGIPEPVASVIIGAASGSMKFAATGAAIGSLYGGLTGAADEVDDTGRTSAIIGAAAATVGLIIATVSLVTAIPSGGTSSVGVAAGIKIALAGISVLTAAAGSAAATANAIKTFTATDAKDIDWNNIDWDRVGAKAAEQAINGAADGYMWGSIAGAVYGGAEGYADYYEHSAPYSTYEERIKHTPRTNGDRGTWTGQRGESNFVLKEPIVCSDGTKITQITYKNGIPDFSHYATAEVKISAMTNNRSKNFLAADDALSDLWTKIKFHGKSSWTGSDVEAFRIANRLTWHEMNNMQGMQLVPTELNGTFGHLGGVGEYNAMIGQQGEIYD